MRPLEVRRLGTVGYAAALDMQRALAAYNRELAAEEQESQVFDPEDEGPAYLRAFVETRVFFEKTVDASSVREILNPHDAPAPFTLVVLLLVVVSATVKSS